MTYAESRAWLDSLGEFHMEFGLERVKTVLAHLGNPERHGDVIHVAGTNGKGMTCAYAAAILRHAGKRVGLYTSPHLSRPNERIAILGHVLDDDRFAHAMTETRAAIDATKTPLTYFEAMTVAAFVAFRASDARTQVIEVGLGGRLDATNVVQPKVTVITSISLDHTKLLGDTIEQIAAEKAGILKKGVPVVLAANDPRAIEVIEKWAAELGCPVVTERDGDPGWHSSLREKQAIPTNAASQLAMLAVRRLYPHVSDEVLRNGIADAAWPGRGEVIEGQRHRIYLDGAHNPAAAAALVEAKPFSEAKERVILFAAMQDKDRLGMLRELAKLQPTAVIVTNAGTARSATARLLAEDARAAMGDGVEIQAIEDVDEAFNAADRASGMHGRIVVCGSLYLVGKVRERISGQGPTKIG